MKRKIRLLSFVFFISAILVFIPRISRAAQYNSASEVPINYTIKINKVDSADNKNLKGAKFTLKDVNGNEVVAPQTTDEDGILTFGNIKTYGNGTDIYYIEEVRSPRGYILDEKETIEVTVQKTVTNVATGAYKLRITCQTLDYETDISRYDYVPVSTVEQLKKIGSGAVFFYDGKPYKYTASTNYRLMNDIDLSGINWEPISIPVSGIFDGNGHSIKNLTIASNEKYNYKEIGLFKVYSGIVSDLNLENVTIAVPGYTSTATSITGKSGVGAFAGFMGSGTFKNCTVSGTISAGVNNVGGLVGHSAENVIIKFQNCTNYANISSYGSMSCYNFGGLIGCAMCSLSVDDCTNEGTISGNTTNVGGLVGYTESKGYEEKAVKAGYAEDGNTITLLIGNSRSEGEYDLYLEDYDLRSLNILPGGVFTVFDSTLEPIEGFENVTLEEGRLRIGTVNIKFEGKDTYYVKDVTPVDGYRKIAGYIKVVVTRYWDFQAEKFRVSVTEKVIAEDKIQEELGNNTDIDLDSISDTFAPDISFENVGWNNAKATFINCTNNAAVGGYMNVAGIVGTAHVRVTMDNCKNTATVGARGFGKAGGMIAELYKWQNDFIQINNCENTGLIESYGSTGAAAGMVAHSLANIRVANCTNKGIIRSTNKSASSGILADATGIIYIDSCTNEGEVYAYGRDESENVDANAAGMLAKNRSSFDSNNVLGLEGVTVTKSSNNVQITNCTNTGKITSACHLGGMIGQSEANSVTIIGCTVKDTSIEDIWQADKGGIAGYLEVPYVTIKDCTVDNIDLKRTSDLYNVTYGPTGGIVGNWCKQGASQADLQNMTITNCNVSNSNIETKGQSTAGIVGASINEDRRSSGTLVISSCNVSDSTIFNKETANTYGSSAGILAMSFYIKNVIIDDCVADTVDVKSALKGSSTGSQNVSGIAAMIQAGENYTISNCDVKNSTITNLAGHNDGCANVSGIVAYAHALNNNSKCTIRNCNVENTDISTTEGNCSGILGSTNSYYTNSESNYPIIISNCSVKNIEMNSVANGNGNSSGPNTTLSGMVGYACSNISMTENTVDNAKIKMNTSNSGAASNVAGFLGMGNGKGMFAECEISNSELYSNGAYGRNANIAGIAGYLGSGAEFYNCSATDTTFTGNNVEDEKAAAANVAGIVGCVNNGTATIRGCDVEGCSMLSKSTGVSNGSNATVSGIIGVASDLIMTGSSVDDCNLTGSGMELAGVASVVYGSTTLSGVTATNITIVDNGTNESNYGKALRSIGGIVASAYGFTGSGLTVDNIDVKSHVTSIGGIAGSVYNMKSLTESSVNDFTVDNDNKEIFSDTNGSIAGLVGDIAGETSKVISGNTVTNTTLVTVSDNVAGLIGTITGGNITGCTVNNVKAENKNKYSGKTGSGNPALGDVGGLVAYSGEELEIVGSSVKNSTLKVDSGESTKVKNAGGLVGFGKDTTITGSNVIATTINNARGVAGGIIGMVDKNSTNTRTLTISGSTVSGNTEVVGTNHAGGIIGFGKIVASNNNISGVTVSTSGEESEAGGIVGVTDSGSSISGVTASDVSVTSSQHAGGIAGVMKGTIEDINISSSSVTASEEAGGIVAVLEGSIKDSTVDDVTVSSVSGDAGGAVGVTTGVVENVTVKNSSVTSSKLAGGVVGAGIDNIDKKTTLIDLTIENNTVSAPIQGDYIGAPNIYEESQEDPEEDPEADGNQEGEEGNNGENQNNAGNVTPQTFTGNNRMGQAALLGSDTNQDESNSDEDEENQEIENEESEDNSKTENQTSTEPEGDTTDAQTQEVQTPEEQNQTTEDNSSTDNNESEESSENSNVDEG